MLCARAVCIVEDPQGSARCQSDGLVRGRLLGGAVASPTGFYSVRCGRGDERVALVGCKEWEMCIVGAAIIANET